MTPPEPERPAEHEQQSAVRPCEPRQYVPCGCEHHWGCWNNPANQSRPERPAKLSDWEQYVADSEGYHGAPTPERPAGALGAKLAAIDHGNPSTLPPGDMITRAFDLLSVVPGHEGWPSSVTMAVGHILDALQQAEQGRVPCKCGKDTAAVANAQCYTCRNQPIWDLTEKLQQAEARLDARYVEGMAAGAAAARDALQQVEARAAQKCQHCAGGERILCADCAATIREEAIVAWKARAATAEADRESDRKIIQSKAQLLVDAYNERDTAKAALKQVEARAATAEGLVKDQERELLTAYQDLAARGAALEAIIAHGCNESGWQLCECIKTARAALTPETPAKDKGETHGT